MSQVFKKLLPEQVHGLLKIPLNLLKHDVSLRSIAEKIIKSNYYGQYDNVNKLLKYKLDKYLGPLPKGYRSLLICSLAKILNPCIHIQSHRTIQNRLLDETSDLSALSATEKLWSDLQYVAIRFAMFRWSRVLRNKALKATFHRVGTSKARLGDIVNAFKGALDRSNIALALDMVKSSENRIDEELRQNMLFYYYICLNGNYMGELKTFMSGPNDNFYRDFILDRKIAIVGPAVTAENNGKEIDSYDVVVRLGYKGRKFMPEPEKGGLRCDISYYGNGNAELYIARKDSGFLRDLEWAIFKSRKYIEHASEISAGRKRCFIRNNFYFSGSPMMMQNAVFDVLHFKPKQVKLFNTNFNCAEVRHYKEYMPTQDQWKMFLGKREHVYYRTWPAKPIDTGGFAHHDLLSQVNFIRNLWSRGTVEVDRECERVLKMSNEEYLVEMERHHILTHITPIPERF